MKVCLYDPSPRVGVVTAKQTPYYKRVQIFRAVKE